MSNSFQPIPGPAIIQHLPGASSAAQETRKAIYEANRDRIYSFAFWMTDSELEAEELSERTFLRAFSLTEKPSAEGLDRALVCELRRKGMQVSGPLQLRSAVVRESAGVRRNTRRDDLERAIVQLPHTERMIFCMHDGDGYDHARIAHTLGITEDESRHGLHQARLRIRELISRSHGEAAA